MDFFSCTIIHMQQLWKVFRFHVLIFIKLAKNSKIFDIIVCEFTAKKIYAIHLICIICVKSKEVWILSKFTEVLSKYKTPQRPQTECAAVFVPPAWPPASTDDCEKKISPLCVVVNKVVKHALVDNILNYDGSLWLLLGYYSYSCILKPE